MQYYIFNAEKIFHILRVYMAVQAAILAGHQYELIPELTGYGFVSKARAEKKARELEGRA